MSHLTRVYEDVFELLPDVKNYDGSWTEYGNLIGMLIENPTGGSSGTK
jgi:3-mercaptopyruvate sulfurtransferase SseA